MSAHAPALIAGALWIFFLVAVMWRFRDSKSLDEYPLAAPEDPPLVSVILPARNEAHNIDACLRSILGTTWPNLEVIVVDDHSTDGTGAIARRVAEADARVRVISAPELPEGWFGKQWACHTGARDARGGILCFIDADTRHGPELLARSVNALRARGSDLFTVAGRQEMLTFWEKVVQPVVFAILLLRYGGMERMSRSTRPREKIANGQFLLITREAYDRTGGHAAVRDHVAEDLRLAQRFTAEGLAVHMVLAPDHLSTRMYTSLRELRKGWGKNIFAAGRDTLPFGALARLLFPFVLPFTPLVAIVPMLAFLLGWSGVLGPEAIWFAAITAPGHLLFWMAMYGFARTNPLWALLHPLGALVFVWICVEASWRGSRVSWKGRDYISRAAGESTRSE